MRLPFAKENKVNAVLWAISIVFWGLKLYL